MIVCITAGDLFGGCRGIASLVFNQVWAYYHFHTSRPCWEGL